MLLELLELMVLGGLGGLKMLLTLKMPGALVHLQSSLLVSLLLSLAMVALEVLKMFEAPLALKMFEALILKTHPLEALLALKTFGALLPPLKMGSGSEEVHGLE